MPRLLVRRTAARTLRCFSSGNNSNVVAADPSLVDDQRAPATWKPHFAVVYPQMVTEEEADWISEEILKTRMRRKRYQGGHWDSVIADYRETELLDIHQQLQEQQQDSGSGIAGIFGRLQRHLHQQHFTAKTVQWLPCHAIDLKKGGELRAHVDSVRFSGHMVAGLSLLSPAIMRLRPSNGNETDDETKEMTDASNGSSNDDQEQEQQHFVDLHLPPRSLYVLTGAGRYDFSHELLPDGATFAGQAVERDQRLSIIFRDAKEDCS